MSLKQVLALAALLTFAAASRAEVVVFAKTDAITGSGVSAKTYEFDINTAGPYSANLIDLQFFVPFQVLAAGVSETGGPLVGQTSAPGSFSLGFLDPGSYTAIVFGQPKDAPFASSFSLSVSLIPEPQVWVFLALGLGLVMWQRVRARTAS